MTSPILHIVHCIDTEGPLDEDLPATFQRIGEMFDVWLEPTSETLCALQEGSIPLNGKEKNIAKAIAPDLLKYNRHWGDIQEMLQNALSDSFRNEMLDHNGNGWVYSWHCMDHLGFMANPRRKDIGYGNIFRFYEQILKETNSNQDEINWHFHPLSVRRSPLSAATSYQNSMDILTYILARRIIDNKWFPTTSRPGFHAIRPDSHNFLEQWIPFDYANQSIQEESTGQNDASMGRFGDWSRAPNTWGGYHPHHDDYQSEGNCRRWVFRCLNVGTRFRLMQKHHMREAFEEAREKGSAIIAFADHDYRDIRPDVNYMRSMLQEVMVDYTDVNIQFSGAEQAVQEHILATGTPSQKIESLKLSLTIEDNRVFVEITSGKIFGPQPFLAFKDKLGGYHHDNFDVLIPQEKWTYIFDDHTLPLEAIAQIGVGSAGALGGYDVNVITPA